MVIIDLTGSITTLPTLQYLTAHHILLVTFTTLILSLIQLHYTF